MKRIFVSALLLSAFIFNGQTKRPDNWFNLDATNDKVNGVSTERAYKELLKDKKSTTIIVGVIDSGVDYDHEDLKNVMWTNPGEIAGNGIDDDKNGYIDDIHGWNFIGGKDGKNVDKDNLEMTRIVRKYRQKFAGKKESDLSSKEEKAEFKNYSAAYADYSGKKTTDSTAYATYSSLLNGIIALNKKVKATLKTDSVRLSNLNAYKPAKEEEKVLEVCKKNLVFNPQMTLDEFVNMVEPAVEYYGNSVNYQLNLDFDPRNIV